MFVRYFAISLFQSFCLYFCLSFCLSACLPFFLAFFPQFVDPVRGDPGAQFLALGVLLIGVVLVSDTLFVLAAGAVTRYLKGRGSRKRWPQMVGGLTYIGLGIFSASIDPPAQG